jgi:shikimate kinase
MSKNGPKMKKNIILIGYRCTGKTSVGKKISERLEMPFYDTDDLIKKETGKTIQELVAEKGWPFFRDKEREIIDRLSGLQGCVIAPGGGVIRDERNVAALARHGVFVWLRADVGTIAARMAGDCDSTGQRPSLTGGDPIAEIEQVLRERLPDYEKLADFSVDTSSVSIEAAAERISDFIQQSIEGESCPEAR